MELGQLVQEPCSFSLTMPSSNPRYRTSPPSSCTVGLGKKDVSKCERGRVAMVTGTKCFILEWIFTSCYLIRVSSSSLIMATTSSSSSDGAAETNGRFFKIHKELDLPLLFQCFSLQSWMQSSPVSGLGLLSSLTTGSPDVKKSMMAAKTSGLITFHSILVSDWMKRKKEGSK